MIGSSFVNGANLSQLLNLCHMVGLTLGFLDGSTCQSAIHANHPPHTQGPISICKWRQFLNMPDSVYLVLLGWRRTTSCSTCRSCALVVLVGADVETYGQVMCDK